MRRFAIFALLSLLASPVLATDFFVRVDGSDSVCDGTTNEPASGAPTCSKLTLTAGMALVPSGGGHRLLVGPGTYQPQATQAAGAALLSVNKAGSNASSLTQVVCNGPGVCTISGLDLPAISDSGWLACDAAADCDGNSASDLSSTRAFYQDIGTRPIGLVYEVNMTPFLIDCDQATGDNTEVAGMIDKPIPYGDCRSSEVNDTSGGGGFGGSAWSCVSQAAGTFTVTGSKLVIHTWADDTSAATVQASRNIETSHLNVIVALGSQWTKLDGFEVAYGGGGPALVQISTSNVRLYNSDVHSGHGPMVTLQSSGANNNQVVNTKIHDSRRRAHWNLGDVPFPCTYPLNTSGQLDNCGWCEGSALGDGEQGSWCMPVSGVNAGQSGHLFQDLEIYNCWNGMQLDNVDNSDVIRCRVHNMPNHGLYMVGKIGANAHCSGNQLIENMAWNVQDSDSVGCVGTFYTRNFLPGMTMEGETGSAQSSTAGKFVGNLFAAGINFNKQATGAASSSGATSNRNWMNNDNADFKCKDGAVDLNNHLRCVASWGSGPFDANSVFGTTGDTGVKLAGFATWPPTLTWGASTDLWTKANFVPTTGSTLIDVIPANSIDVDGDGVNDPCDSAHHCSGSGFDIGPLEFGIDTGGGGTPDTTPPSAATLSVTGQAETSCTLQWTTSFDDGNNAASGNPQTIDIRRRTGATTVIDEDTAEWSGATVVTGEPSPLGGTVQSMTVTGLTASTQYSFNIKIADDTPNTSALGTAASCTTTTATSSTHIDCTAAAFESMIAACPVGTVTFNCPAGTTITMKHGRCSGGAQGECYLDADCTGGSSGTCSRTYRATTCTGLVVDGENKVTFVPGIKWWNKDICGAGTSDCDTNNDQTPDACPGGSNDTGHFLNIGGNGNTFKNFAVNGFIQAFAFNGNGDTTTGTGVTDNVVENVDITLAGDDAITNEDGAGSQSGGGPNIIRGTAGDHMRILDGCDKGIQMNGRDTDLSGHTGYDLVIGPYVDLVNTADPLRIAHNGRFKIDRVDVREENPPTVFSCTIGPRFGSGAGTVTKAFVEWVDSNSSGCKYGLQIEDTVHVWMHGTNIITGNRTGGIGIGGSSRLVMDTTQVVGNGGTFTSGTPTFYGGVSITSSALVEAGDGGSGLDLDILSSGFGLASKDSTGGNLLQGNAYFGSSAPCDVNDNGTGARFFDGNCWGDQNAADQIQGTNAASVVVTPLDASCAPPEPEVNPRVVIDCRGCN